MMDKQKYKQVKDSYIIAGKMWGIEIVQGETGK